MLSLTDLPLTLLLVLAAATFMAAASSRTLFPNPGVVAGWSVRIGLLLALAVVAAMVVQVQPAGTVAVTLWRIDPELPVTLQFGIGGLGIAAVALLAALVVSFAAADRRPLVYAALGVAALGSVMAALAGDLVSLFVGLQLSAAGGIGISYARSPRRASHRILWAGVADQSVALVWLGAAVALYHSAGTVQFSDVPTSSVNYVLAALLLLPALVRLGSVTLLLGAPGQHPGERGLDVADWLVVAAVPTALVVLLRDLQLSGGTWPAPSFGTILDALGLGLALAVSALVWREHRSAAASAALLPAAASLMLLGFGLDSPVGVELAVAAALFLEALAGFLPRTIGPATVVRPESGDRVGTALWVGVMAAGSPLSLGFAAALLGLALGLRSGGGTGLMPTLGYAACLFLLCLIIPACLRRPQAPPSWRLWFLIVPGGFLVVGAIAGGWVLTGLGAALAFSGANVPVPVTAPDPLLLQLPGILFPQGYLAVLAGLLLLAVLAFRYAAGLPVIAGASAEPALVGGVAPPGWARRLDFQGVQSALSRARQVAETGLALAERELAERPVWLWLTTAAAIAWLMAQR